MKKIMLIFGLLFLSNSYANVDGESAFEQEAKHDQCTPQPDGLVSRGTRPYLLNTKCGELTRNPDLVLNKAVEFYKKGWIRCSESEKYYYVVKILDGSFGMSAFHLIAAEDLFFYN